MPEDVPRRLIEELVTGWQLTGERVVLVEGSEDQRFFRLVQAEEHCGSGFVALLPLAADSVDISGELVERHGFSGTGAKQRVIAFTRAVAGAGAADGFRGVVDRDQDRLLSLDFESDVLRYTDHGCMEVYGWSPQSLRQLLIQFKCDAACPTGPADVRRLFHSVGEVCATLAAFRAVAQSNQEWGLEVHRVESTLSVGGGRVQLDLPAYIRLARPIPPAPRVNAEVVRMQGAIGAGGELSVMNGHDLVWVLQVVLRELSDFPRRMIELATVHGAIVSLGVMDPAIFEEGLFRTLNEWAAA